LANKAYCGGCGSKPGWVNTVKIAAWTRDEDPVDNEQYYLRLPCNREMRGLAIEGYLDCLKLDFVCRLPALGEASTLSLLGRALQHKAALKLMERDAATNKVNQFTLLNAESRAARIRMYQESYFNLLLYAAQNIPAGASSCWGCGKTEPIAARITI
jgi:hypothetical protein